METLDQFAKHRNGKQSSCKACVKKYSKQRRKVMKEKRRKNVKWHQRDFRFV